MSTPKAIPYAQHPVPGYNMEQFHALDPEIYQYHDPRTPEEYLQQYLDFIGYENLTEEERRDEGHSLLWSRLNRIQRLIELNAPDCILHSELRTGVVMDYLLQIKLPE